MIDMYEVIDKLEAQNYIRVHKQVGNYMQIYCPFHNDGNERKPSCGILLHEEVRGGQIYPAGLFHCFTCHYAKSLVEAIEDLLKIHGVNQSGLMWLTQNITNFEAETDEFDALIPTELMDSINSKYTIDCIKKMSETQQTYISEAELSKYRYTVPYMYERKLTDELIEKYDIGYDANWIPPGRKKPIPCITFPVRDSTGRTLFFCRRSIEGKLFNYPAGVTKPLYGIYELPDGCKSVVVCESCFNALTSTKYGRPAVATLGTGNALQIQQLKSLGVQEYILAFDPDEAGKKATEKFKRALSKIAIVWVLTGIPEGKDINDLTLEEFNNLELE